MHRNVFVVSNQDPWAMRNQSGLFYEYSGYNLNDLTSGGFHNFKFQQENESVGSPTLTTNSGRSEITEASTDFCFPAKQPEICSLFPQLNPMQQPSYADMQLLQQHAMAKQMQDLQRRNQLQQFSDTRQPNSLNPFMTIHKQAVGGQFPPLVDGMSTHEASQVYLNWAQRAAQGTQGRAFLSPEQGQALRSMGLAPAPAPQQLDTSLYGTPIAGSRGSLNQQFSVQGLYQEPLNLFARASGQAENFGNTILKDQCIFSQDQMSLPEGAFMPNQGIPGKNMFGTGPVHGLSSAFVSGSLQVGNAQQINASMKDFGGRQEQFGWPDMQEKTAQPTQGFVPLDPIEEKILFNMDDNTWDGSFSRVPDVGPGGLSGMLDTNDLPNAFPSIQSGSWSALMQSAVAEASSSDTGHQEEWSGLTFQNTEPSGDNQASNFIDSDKQQNCWVNNSLPSSAPFSSKPLPTISNFGFNSSFANSQQQDDQASDKQIKGIRHDGTPESIDTTTRVTGQWVDRSPRQKPPAEASKLFRPYMHQDNICVDQTHVNPTGMVNRLQSGVSNMPFGRENLRVSGITASPGVTSQLNLAEAQYTSQENSATHGKLVVGSQSSQRAVFPPRIYNVWTNVPTRQQTSMPESLRDSMNSCSIVDVSRNNVVNSMMLQNTTSGVNDSPQTAGFPQVQEASTKRIPDANASSSIHLHSQPPKLHGTRPGDDQGPAASAGYSSRPATSSHSNYPSLHHLSSVNDTETDPTRKDLKTKNISDLQRVAAMMRQYQHNSRIRPAGDSGLNLKQLNSSASGANKMLGLMMEAGEGQSVKALPQLMQPGVSSPAMVDLHQTHSQSHTNCNSVVSSRTEHGQLNLNALSTLHKQQSVRSGHMLPVHDPSHAGVSASQDASVGPSKDTISELPNNQDMAIIRPKKRKFIAPERLAWHKEVSQGPQTEQGLSIATQEWARATNRLLNKVEDEAEMVECVQTVRRSKKRLLLTSHLMQLLFHPAPAFLFSGSASSQYDSLLYFVARATLGNACSLTYCRASTSDESSMTSDSGKTLERRVNAEYSEAVDKLTEKAKKLESEFQRLENSSSMLDIRVHLQDMERFCVINRYARIHSRVQVNSENSPNSRMTRQMPQRHVTVVPLPMKLPEEVHCHQL